MGVLGAEICTNRKSNRTSQYLSIQRFARSATVWPGFQCQIMPPPSPPIQTPRLVGGQKWYQSKCCTNIPIQLNYRPILHRLATIHNVTDKQTTDRAIGIGCLCYSISGLIIQTAYNNNLTAASSSMSLSRFFICSIVSCHRDNNSCRSACDWRNDSAVLSSSS